MSNKKTKRQIVAYADSEMEAFEELVIRQEAGQKGLAVAEVRRMIDPPKTAYKYIIFRIIED